MKEHGSFRLTVNGKTVCHYFSTEAHSAWALENGYDKTLLLQNGKELRALKLTKTRAYVVVGEDEHGVPIEERWIIRNLRFYE